MGDYKLAAWTLLTAVLTVMLISLANVANLLLARMAERRTEIAIRTAIGISPTRLLCQLITESLLIAVTGGVIGCALGSLLLRFLIATDANGIPHLAEARLDTRVLAFCFALSLLAGVIFGLVPALQPLSSEFLSSSHSVAARFSTFLKNGLVTSQLALSVVLLACASLLSQSLWNLETQSLGMQTGHVLTAQLILPTSRYMQPAERIAFFNTLEQRMNTILGVRAVGLSDSIPPAGWERSRPIYSLEVVGHPRQKSGAGGMVNWRYVSPGYFEALRIPILAGRAFKEDDRRPGTNLCIVSESLAHRLLPSISAVGQQLKFHTDVPYQIVGVVPDVKNIGLAFTGAPEYYILRTHSLDDTYLNMTGPVAQRTVSIVLRGDTSDPDLISAVKQQMAIVDPNLPVQIYTMDERLSELTAGPRFYAVLLIAFSCVGLLLAAVGLYGTVSYLVTQRTKEVGIRMALGATPAEVAKLILRHSATWTFVGLAIGVPAALLASKLLSSLLFQVSARDPLTIAVSVTTLLLASLLAVVKPVRRAASVDPVSALRNDN
jgi:predicted permease